MNTETFTWLAVFAGGSAILNAFGIMAIYWHREWAEKAREYVMCFAAGMLIASALMLALPEAIEANSHAGPIALLGFLFLFFSSEWARRTMKRKELAFGVTAAEGIGIHSFIDGIIYAVTFKISIVIGVLSVMGLVVHEFAEGVITYSVLSGAGVHRKTSAWCAFLISGLTTPLGAFVVYPLISRVSKSVEGLLLGFAAGVLLYVSAAHLLPETREHTKGHSIVVFLAGVALAAFLVIAGA